MSYPNSNRSVENVIFLLREAIKNNETLPNVCQKYGKGKNYAKDYINKKSDDHLERDIISPDEYNTLRDLHDEYKSNLDQIKKEELVKRNKEGAVGNRGLEEEESVPKEEVEYDAYKDENFDERSVGEPVRDESDPITLQHNFGLGGTKGNEIGRISGYRYHIMIRGEDDLVGELTREEMEMVYKLYSNIDGAGITQRSLSRYFKNLTLRDLKRILRAFNITKQSAPVPPHIIEEKDPDKVVELIHQNKEDFILKKLEEDRAKKTQERLREKEKENIELREKLKNWKETLENLEIKTDEIEPFYIEQKEDNNEKALVLYLSDQHVGAETDKDSIYNNEYNEREFFERMKKTFHKIQDEVDCHGTFDNLIVCNLGDCVDGFNGETTRGGHQLEQNMDNKEQFNTYVNTMIQFFDSLHRKGGKPIANKICYYAVGNDNHSGDIGYIANKTLEHVLSLKYPQMDVRVFEKFIEHVDYGYHTLILSHGKDKEYMNSGFPLNLTDKTENFFNDYITKNRIVNPYVSVVMGDLHQTLVQYAKRFRYKRVLSMYGGSGFIHTNFGSGHAGVEYDILNKYNNDIRSGIVEF